MLALAGLILLTAISCFFLQEFIRTFKRIFSILGAKLVLPLALASYLVYGFYYWVLCGREEVAKILDSILGLLISLLPAYSWSSSVALILLLTIISVVPVAIINAIHYKRTYKIYPYSYVVTMVIWIICAVLFIAK